MIWGYAPTGAPANTARDVGGRLMAITIWGPRASGGSYAAISALTNTPATILAFAVYDFLLGSSTRIITPYHADVYRARAQYHAENDLLLQKPDRFANAARGKPLGKLPRRLIIRKVQWSRNMKPPFLCTLDPDWRMRTW
ncbi:hypothetical protein EDC04DRAFT_988924 [Pisolithus marmoratus]|nr:hypothetical protein EDC04DRAFT_988924 [Pisolithus marmoratus]